MCDLCLCRHWSKDKAQSVPLWLDAQVRHVLAHGQHLRLLVQQTYLSRAGVFKWQHKQPHGCTSVWKLECNNIVDRPWVQCLPAEGHGQEHSREEVRDVSIWPTLASFGPMRRESDHAPIVWTWRAGWIMMSLQTTSWTWLFRSNHITGMRKARFFNLWQTLAHEN